MAVRGQRPPEAIELENLMSRFPCQHSVLFVGGDVPLHKTLANIPDFDQLCSLLHNADASLSFWGTRCITLKNFSKTLTLEDLIGKVFELLQKNPHFNLTERGYGQIIAAKLDELAAKIRVQETNATGLTFLILRIRAFFSHYLGDDDILLYLWKDMEGDYARLTPLGITKIGDDDVAYNQVFLYNTERQQTHTKRTPQWKFEIISPPPLFSNKWVHWLHQDTANQRWLPSSSH